MYKSSTKVNLSGKSYDILKAEAMKTSTPMSKILRDYAIEYIKLKLEAENLKSGKITESSNKASLIIRFSI
jgi:hypothetical protein